MPVFAIVLQGQAALEIEEHRYPFAGSENARVKLGVVSVDTGATTFVDLGAKDGYLARVDWHPDGRLLVQWLSRDWKRLELRAYTDFPSLASGGATDIRVAEFPAWAASGSGPILVENLEPWINLHYDLRFVESTGEFI